MKAFFDIHFHVMTLKEPNLIAFIDALESTSTAALLQGNLTKDYIFTPTSFFKGRMKEKIENTLSCFSRPIENTFSLMEADLKGEISNKFKPYIKDGKFIFRGVTYDRIFLSPLLIDFSQSKTAFEKLYYKFPHLDKITPYALDTIDAIKAYLQANNDSLFSFYPFIGINPVAHSLSFIKELFERFIDNSHLIHNNENIDTERIFFGVKLYPPLGFNPWPKDKNELEKVRYIYSFCQANEIPIITHCDDQGFKGIDSLDASKYTNPQSWMSVLENYPYLIIDFAHFGKQYALNKGSDFLSSVQSRIKKLPSGEWFYKLMSMILKYDNVYTDISFTGCNKEFYVEALNYLDTLSINERNKIESRMLFGTDFSINLLKLESYLEFYNILDSSPFSDDLIYKMCSLNPYYFLRLKERDIKKLEKKKVSLLSFFKKK